MNEADQTLAAKLNLETGQLGWSEIERHFARGQVIKVCEGQDLVNIAQVFTEDDKDAVRALLKSTAIAKADMTDAAVWHAEKTVFWAIVVAPWVLVQAVTDQIQPLD